MYFRIIFSFQMFLSCFAVTKHCHSDRCYWISDTTTADWTGARTACQSEGGDLAVMETEELYNYVKNTFSNPTWIGLTDEGQESDFRWLNGAPLYYQKFTSSDPNGKRDENCVALRVDKDWQDDQCTTTTRILCSALAPNCTSVKDGCSSFPTGFIGKYTGPYGPSHWQTAKEQCESLGQKLMTIDSQEEEDHVQNTLNPTEVLFLGVTDMAVESSFRTTDGFAAPWLNWYSTQPDGKAGTSQGVEDCGGRNIWGHLADYLCQEDHLYYCEAPRVYVNGAEVTTDELIDNDDDTCVQLSVSNGCSTDQIRIESRWAEQMINLKLTMANASRTQLTVMWEETSNGKFQRCNLVTTEIIDASEMICNYVCDITNGATTNIKIISKSPAENQPEICDVKVF